MKQCPHYPIIMRQLIRRNGTGKVARPFPILLMLLQGKEELDGSFYSNERKKKLPEFSA